MHCMDTLTYTINLEPVREGGFVVSVPSLPGCHTYGATYEEAVSMAKECIEGFLEALVKAGQRIPLERNKVGGYSAQVPVRAPLPA